MYPQESNESERALVRGEPLEKFPDDLYIPPDALRVILEAFEGPLDLLLYLIRRQNLDILDIPVLLITEQYMSYIDAMQNLEIELAGEYLLMAAMLAEIKSRMLLPRPSVEEEEGADPRAELVRRLQEYERYKEVSENLDELPRVERDLFPVHLTPQRVDIDKPLPKPQIEELLHAFRDVMLRAELFTSHQVQREPLSVRERMSGILERLQKGERVAFASLFIAAEGRLGVVVSFIAILELTREELIQIDQSEAYGEIHLSVAGAGRQRSRDYRSASKNLDQGDAT